MDKDQIIVKTNGENNTEAQGSEIWIVGVIIENKWYSAEKIFDHTWLKRGNMIGWNSYTKECISNEVWGRLPAGGKTIQIVFQKNRWRGMCYIKYREKEMVADCYDDIEEGLQYVEVWNSQVM